MVNRLLAVGNTTSSEGDGFVAKLAAQILQNLLVTVEDVHIKYEDSVTHPERPFAIGLTMKKLALESTDSLWKESVISEPSMQFFKLLSLESLAVYWLTDVLISSIDWIFRGLIALVGLWFQLTGPTELLSKWKEEDQVDGFKRGISSSEERPYENSYIAGPITACAKLRINTKPELDGSNYSVPKISLNLLVEEISMGLTPHQYEDIIKLLNNIERMNRAAPYRKYRPLISSYKKYALVWWLYAYQCVLEENVRRRRRNWSWTHIKRHRNLVGTYIDLYKLKLEQKKEDRRLQEQIDELEEHLDVFNITLARRQAEVQVLIIIHIHL